MIPPRAVRAAVPSVSEPLRDLINTIIAKAEVPEGWKYGQIRRTSTRQRQRVGQS